MENLNHLKLDHLHQECVYLIDIYERNQKFKHLFRSLLWCLFWRLTASGNFHWRLVSRETNYLPINLVNGLSDSC